MKIKKIKKLINKVNPFNRHSSKFSSPQSPPILRKSIPPSSHSSPSIFPSYSSSPSCSPSIAPGEIEPKYVKKTIRCSNCKKVLTRCNILITKEYYSYDSEDSPRTLPEVIEEEEVLCDMCYKLMKLKE